MKTKLDLRYLLQIVILSVAISLILFSMFRVGALEPLPFDHTLCQYPLRSTNPIDGCDNSDPAIPECQIKARDDSCVIRQPQAEPESVFVPSVPPAALDEVEIVEESSESLK